VLEVLIGLAVVVLLGWVLWWQTHDPGPSKRRPTSTPAVCEWCQWREGDDCRNPKSPMAGQACGPVCSGKVRCRYTN